MYTLQSSDGIVLRLVDNDLAKFSTSNISFHKDITMNEGLINNLRNPENDSDAANKKYVDSLIGTTAPNITSTPAMTSNNTTINGLTYTTVASSMSGGQTRAWRAFTNEVITPGSPASNSGWVPSAKDATPWIQMQYPSAVVVTSFIYSIYLFVMEARILLHGMYKEGIIKEVVNLLHCWLVLLALLCN